MRINKRILKNNCIIYYILSYYYTDSEITNMAKYCEMFGIFLTKFSSIFEILNLITLLVFLAPGVKNSKLSRKI